MVAYLGLTHFITLGSTEQIPPSLNVKNRHLDIPKCGPEGLLLNLPDTCRHIQEAIDCDGRVLVYCLAESNAAIVVGAYRKPSPILTARLLTSATSEVMWSQNISSVHALKLIHDGVVTCSLRHSYVYSPL